MDPILQKLCEALNETVTRVLNASGSINSNGKTLKEEVNSSFPAITKTDLCDMAYFLSRKLNEAKIENVDDFFKERLIDLPRRLELLWPEVIPNMFANNASLYAYIETLATTSRIVDGIIASASVIDERYYPIKTASRLKTAAKRIDRIEVDQEGLETRVARINSAYLAAEKLPGTLQELEEARTDLEDIRLKVDKTFEESTKAQGKTEAAALDAMNTLQVIKNFANEAKELINKCEEAYSITTTKGLAGAFDQRARRLNFSIILWVAGLLVALVVGGFFGSKRIDMLSQITSTGSPNWGIIAMHVVFSILSIGGPLWFAWLSTKQIGQRFRLAEDYAFKASVAKAYEGYRKEASRLDEAFSSRLFSSALARLEEAPLRLVEQEAHGSPWQEAARSGLIKKTWDTVPEFRDQVSELAKKYSEPMAAAIAARVSGKEPSGGEKAPNQSGP